MVDTPTTPVIEAPATPKKTPKTKKETSPGKVSHPSTAVMVNSAVKNLKERGGSSLQAIKKYIASTYKVDAEKMAPFIRKAIKSSVASGALVQTKGKGASGSFKLTGEVISPKKPASPKKSPAKKVAKPKKSPTKTPSKSPSKAKKIAKTPTKKPKSPKPKSVKAKASPKKK